MFPDFHAIGALVMAQSEGQKPQATGFLLPLMICLGIFYFLVFLPGAKERKKRRAMLDSLKRGDEIVTSSGVIGTISDMSETIVTLEVARNVKIRVLKSAVAKKTAELQSKAEQGIEGATASKASKS